MYLAELAMNLHQLRMLQLSLIGCVRVFHLPKRFIIILSYFTRCFKVLSWMFRFFRLVIEWIFGEPISTIASSLGFSFSQLSSWSFSGFIPLSIKSIYPLTLLQVHSSPIEPNLSPSRPATVEPIKPNLSPLILGLLLLNILSKKGAKIHVQKVLKLYLYLIDCVKVSNMISSYLTHLLKALGWMTWACLDWLI